MSRFTETLKEVSNAIFKKHGCKMFSYPAYNLRMILQFS